jgi:hypothetical protein
MSNALGSLPPQLQAGDTWSWTEASATYPGPAWSLSYVLLSDAVRLTIAAVWSVDGAHVFAKTAAQSVLIAPGAYAWTEIATHTDGRRTTLGQGLVTILADPLTLPLPGVRSHARRMLAAIDACLEGRASEGDLDLVATAVGTSGGTRSSQFDLGQLIATRRYYSALVAGENATDQRAAGIRAGQVQVVFA